MSDSAYEGRNIFGDHILGDKILGDSIFVQEGIGKVVNEGSGNVTGVSKSKDREPQEPTDLRVTLQNLSDAVVLLRRQLAEQDRVVLDDSVRLIRDGGDEPGTVRRAFYSIAGLAAVVSGVGVPIIESVRQIIGAINS